MRNNNKPMRLLLIEDDIGDAMRLTECANRRTDIKFVGITDSCEEGLKLVRSRLPEGVILDLQLVAGKGTGLQFMKLLKDAEDDLPIYPLVVVTTSTKSRNVLRQVEELGSDWIFCKQAEGYDENTVFETLLTLRPALYDVKKPIVVGGINKSRDIIETPDDRRTRIYKRIDIELDLVGLRARLRGRAYLREAIYIQMHSEKERGSGIDEVARKEQKAYQSVAKAMQTAIIDAWDSADVEEIYTHYTARIPLKTGVPYVSDFIHYYADKIKKSID